MTTLDTDEADNPIAFPETEDWDKDDFGGGDTANEELHAQLEIIMNDTNDDAVQREEEDSFLPEVTTDHSGDILPTQQLQFLSSSEEYFTAEESP
eukprot:scaffold30929_cov160-Skeletonema_menzelii.AAC.5